MEDLKAEVARTTRKLQGAEKEEQRMARELRDSAAALQDQTGRAKRLEGLLEEKEAAIAALNVKVSACVPRALCQWTCGVGFVL